MLEEARYLITSLGNCAAMRKRKTAYPTSPAIILWCKYVTVMNTAKVKTAILNKAPKATLYEAILLSLKEHPICLFLFVGCCFFYFFKLWTWHTYILLVNSQKSLTPNFIAPVQHCPVDTSLLPCYSIKKNKNPTDADFQKQSEELCTPWRG